MTTTEIDPADLPRQLHTKRCPRCLRARIAVEITWRKFPAGVGPEFETHHEGEAIPGCFEAAAAYRDEIHAAYLNAVVGGQRGAFPPTLAGSIGEITRLEREVSRLTVERDNARESLTEHRAAATELAEREAQLRDRIGVIQARFTPRVAGTTLPPPANRMWEQIHDDLEWILTTDEETD